MLSCTRTRKGSGFSSEPHQVSCFNFLNKSWLQLQPVQGGPLKSIFSRTHRRGAFLGRIMGLSGKEGCPKMNGSRDQHSGRTKGG